MLETLLIIVYAVCSLNTTDLTTNDTTTCECKELSQTQYDDGILELAILDTQD